MDDYNGRGENVNRVMVYVPNSPGWVVSSLLKDSGIENMLISLFLAWLVLTYSTGNWITSTLAVITIGMIATIVLGFLTVSGWGLGVLESILIVIVIGFSVVLCGNQILTARLNCRMHRTLVDFYTGRLHRPSGR